jgi:hypothetical protein
METLTVSHTLRLLIVTALVSWMAVAAAHAEDVSFVLYPTKDAYVDHLESNVSFGTLADLYVEARGLDEKWVYMQFEVPELADATLKEAELDLLGQSFTSTQARRIAAYHVSDDSWQENSITWLNRPAYDALIAAINVGAQNSWYHWDVSSGVASEMSAHDEMISFMLKDVNTSSISVKKRFRSKEMSGTSLDPYMNVTYSLAANHSSDHIVISEVLYSPAVAELEAKFVELYNPAPDAINISGYSLNTPTGQMILPGSAVIPAHGFYLIAGSNFNRAWHADWPHPDYHDDELNLPNADGGLQLRDRSQVVVDAVGWGAPPFGYHEQMPTYNVEAGMSIERRPGYLKPIMGNGFDTNYNVIDFLVRVPEPQNGQSPAEPSIKDTTAPGHVSNLHATGIGTTYLAWGWNNPADPDFDHINVYLNGAFKTKTSSTVYNATLLAANTGYTITLYTVDTSNNSDTGTSNKATTLAAQDHTAPGKVTNLHDTVVGSNHITWSWTNPSDSDFDHVNIYLNGQFVTSIKATQHDATNLATNTPYTLSIETVDSSGNINTDKASDSATTLAQADTTPPGPVTNLHETSAGTTYIMWQWTNPVDSDFDHSEIYLDGQFRSSVAGAFFNASGLFANTQHTISIKTVDKSGNVNQNAASDSAKTLVAKDTTPPASVTNLRVEATGKHFITWAWNNPSDKDFDHVEIFLDSARIGNSSSEAYTASNLEANTSHSIGLRTLDNSSNANPQLITLAASTLAVPIPDIRVIREQSSGAGVGKEMSVQFLLWNNDKLEIENISLIDTIPQGWTITSMPQGATLSGDKIEIPVNDMATDELVLTEYKVEAPQAKGTQGFSGLLKFHANDTDYSMHIPGQTVEVSDDKAFFEVQLDLYLGDNEITRSIANNTEYTAQFEVKNIGAKSVTDYETFIYWPFDSSRWDVRSISPDCAKGSLVDYKGGRALSCAWQPFNENEIKTFTIQLAARSVNEQQSTLNMTYDPPAGEGYAQMVLDYLGRIFERIKALLNTLLHKGEPNGASIVEQENATEQAPEINETLPVEAANITNPVLPNITNANITGNATTNATKNVTRLTTLGGGGGGSSRGGGGGGSSGGGGTSQSAKVWITSLQDIFIRSRNIQAPGDATKLLMSVPHAMEITPSGSSVSWTTNLDGTSKVYFGTSPLLGDQKTSLTLTKIHKLQLQELVPLTEYFYRAESCSQGICINSSIQSFFTLESPFFNVTENLNPTYLRGIISLDGTAAPTGTPFTITLTSGAYAGLRIQGEVDDNIPEFLKGNGYIDTRGRKEFIAGQGFSLRVSKCFGTASGTFSAGGTGDFVSGELVELNCSIDISGPQIDNVTVIPSQPDETNEILISANINDPSWAQFANLSFRANNGNWTMVQMVGMPENEKYFYPIGRFNATTSIEYYIISSDSLENEATIPIQSFEVGYLDADMDGFDRTVDCNDSNPDINPAAQEIPYSGIDDDCNASTRDDDLDMDGYASANDCNDSDASVHPNATEVPYDGIDQDCDGADLVDVDQDGYSFTNDCNDTDQAVHPGAIEIIYNGKDDDCNESTPDDDLDGDGYGHLTDCNDNNASISPAASEIPYNGIDDDCNASTKDDDLDNDGYGHLLDCNDTDSGINPSAEEKIDSVDQNCRNDAPEFNITSQVVGEDTPTAIDLRQYSYDFENDSLTYLVTRSGQNVSCELNGSMLRIIPGAEFVGTDNCSLMVSDGMNDTVQELTIIAVRVNDMPVLSHNISKQSWTEDIDWTLNLADYFVDSDDTNLSYVSTKPADIALQILGSIATFTPVKDWNGIDTIVFNATDSSGATATSNLVELEVTPVNDAPAINISDQTLTEDTPDALNLSQYASDVDSATLNFSVGSMNSSAVSCTVNGETLSMTPAHNFNGNSSCSVIASDGIAQSESSFAITVTPVNDAPELIAPVPIQSWDEDSLHQLNLSSYFKDPEGDFISFNASSTSHINVTFDAWTLRFTPEPDWYGTEILGLVASDGTKHTQTNIVLVVRPINDAPELNLENQTLNEDTLAAINLTKYSSDKEHDYLRYYVSHENLTQVNCEVTDETLTINPYHNFNGKASCVIMVTDGIANTSDVLHITVMPVNDAPELLQEIPKQEWDEDTRKELDFAVYFHDVDGDELNYSSTSHENISVTLENGVAFLVPKPNWYGIGFIKFTARDGILSTESNQVLLEVKPVNDAPTLDIPDQQIDEDSQKELNLSKYAGDIDKDNLIFSVLQSSAHVGCGVASEMLAIEPQQDFNGFASCTIQAFDGFAAVNNTFTINVTAVNDAPRLLRAINATPWDEDTEQTIDLSLYFMDPEGDNITFKASTPENIEVRIVGSIATLTPTRDWYGVSFMNFTASDNKLQTTSNKVLLSVRPVNDAPTLDLPDQRMAEDSMLAVPLTGYAKDIDGDTLVFSLLSSQGVNCTVEAETLTIQSPMDFNGNGTCTIKAFDGFASANDSFMIMVEAVNDAPRLVKNITEQAWDEDTEHSMELREYFVDPEGDILTYTATSPQNIAVIINGSKATLVPEHNWNGDRTIAFTASDGLVQTQGNWVQLIVRPVNDAPVITSKAVTHATEDSQYEYEVRASDVDGDSLAYSLLKAPQGMSIDQDSGLITWEPANDQVGENNVTVQASDGHLYDAQSFIVTVDNTNDPPASVPIPRQVWNEDEQNCVDLNEWFSDVDGDKLHYSVSRTLFVSITVDGSTACMTPASEWSGTANVTVAADDGNGGTAEELMQLSVRQVNDAPVITSRPLLKVLEDSIYTYNITAHDAEGDMLQYSLVKHPNGMTIDSEGRIEWTPSNEEVGENEIVVQVGDGTSITEQKFTIHVYNTNDAPEFHGPIAALVWQEDSTYDLDLGMYFTDPDNDDLRYSASSAENINVQISGQHALLTSTAEWSGTSSVIFTATDPSADSVSSDLVQLIVTSVNDAPRLLPMGIIDAVEGQLIRLEPNAIDPDNDQLTFLFEKPFNQVGEWQTNYTSAGNYTTHITVTDGEKFDTGTVIIRVRNSINHNPELDFIADITVTENDEVSVLPHATDVDGDTLMYTFSKPLDSSGRWKTTFRDKGVYKANVTVSDGQGGKDWQEFNIIVKDSEINHAPTLEQMSDVYVRAGELVSIRPVADDPDGDRLKITISDPVGNDGYWQTQKKDKGVYYITVAVCDGNTTISRVVKVTVDEAAFEQLFVASIQLSSEVLKAGDTLQVIVRVKNGGNIDMKGIEVRGLIMDLAVADTVGPFKLKSGDDIYKMLILEIPAGTKPGVYDIRFTFNNAVERRVIHRSITVI